jgi:hypothetical protein
MNFKPYITSPENAKRIAEWLRSYGGIAIWQSVDPNRADATVATAVNMPDEPYLKPVFEVGDTPVCIITDFADVLVSNDVMKPESQVPLAEYLASKTLKLV